MSNPNELPFDVGQIISMVEGVPMISECHREVSRLIGTGGSADDIGRALSDDMTVCQLMLHNANSAFMGRSKRVENVERAIALLGVNEVARLVKQASLSTALRPFATPPMMPYWQHCYSTAQAARLLAIETRIAAPEEAFTCALLVRVGQAFLMVKFPNEYRELLERVETTGVHLLEAEASYFGVDHTQLGYLLGRRWSLDDGLVNVIHTHFDPEQAGHLLPFAVLLYLADTLTKGLGIGSDGLQRITRSPVRAQTWQDLGWMDLSLEKICGRVVAVADEFAGFWDLLTGAQQ